MIKPLSDSQRAAGAALIAACNAATTAESAFLAAQVTRKDAATNLLRAMAWIKADGTLSKAGIAAVEGKQGSALARAVVPNTWNDLELPAAATVEFDAPTGNAKAKAVADAGKAGQALLDDPSSATPEDLAAARQAVAHYAYMRSLQIVQRAISEALPKAADSTPRKRTPRTPDAPQPDAPQAPAAPPVLDSVISTLETIAAGKTPEGMNGAAMVKISDALKAAQTASAKVQTGKPAAVDHVAAILAMSDTDAHAALRKIAAALAKRQGADIGSVAAAREYVQAHAQIKAAPAPRKAAQA